MDGVDVGHFGGGDDAVALEIAVGRSGRSDAHGPVGQPQVGGVAVGLAEDQHRLDAQLPAAPQDAKGDLTPVGDQDP